MARINLLPWREELRKERQKTFLTQLAAAALLGIGLVIAGHVYLQEKIDNQNQRNATLKSEIKRMDKRIADIKHIESLKRALVDRMEVIQKLQESRPEVVHLFDDMVTTLPDGLYLTRIQQRSSTLSIDGKAESNARVSTYMRNLDRSAWLDDAKLLFIEAKEDKKAKKQASPSNIRSFALQVTQINPESAHDEVEK
ncbi:MAG: PilN domain-containing protein [bacterium]